MTAPKRTYDFTKLRGRIISGGETLESFSSKIPMTAANFSNKLNNKSTFDANQILRMSELLIINNDEEFRSLFFSVRN